MTTKKSMTETEAMTVITARGLETREKALAARVECDVRKWGEGERTASSEMHRGDSHGLLLSSIASYDASAPDMELLRAAKALPSLLSTRDARMLRDGG